MSWTTPSTDAWLAAQQQRQELRDARIRGIRSFMWGLFLDVSAFVVTVLVTAFTAIEWTREYWIALGGLLAKTILQATVAYLARRLFPPSNVAKL